MKKIFVVNEKLKEIFGKKRKKLDINSAFSLECGILGESIFYKKLNIRKIVERYSGDYIKLWKEYYSKIKGYVELVDFYGIMQTDDGNIFEMSKYLQNREMLENTPVEWEEFYKVYMKILGEINTIIKQYNGKIGMDTSIWNFTVDGKLFDLDPPRIFKGKETTFSNENDMGHYQRTFYRNFTEEGMKTNLLATILLGIRKGNIIVENKSNDYIGDLLKGLMNSFKEKEKIKSKLFEDSDDEFSDFENHPIKIIRKI